MGPPFLAIAVTVSMTVGSALVWTQLRRGRSSEISAGRRISGRLQAGKPVGEIPTNGSYGINARMRTTDEDRWCRMGVGRRRGERSRVRNGMVSSSRGLRPCRPDLIEVGGEDIEHVRIEMAPAVLPHHVEGGGVAQRLPVGAPRG